VEAHLEDAADNLRREVAVEIRDNMILMLMSGGEVGFFLGYFISFWFLLIAGDAVMPNCRRAIARRR
jgi:hypothetical protein